MTTPLYTVLSRELMHSMPLDWQARMAACLAELAAAESVAVEEAIAEHHRTLNRGLSDFAVFVAGERLDDTGITLTYLHVTTPHGPVRMTVEEAEPLGACLIHAAGYARDIELEDQL